LRGAQRRGNPTPSLRGVAKATTRQSNTVIARSAATWQSNAVIARSAATWQSNTVIARSSKSYDAAIPHSHCEASIGQRSNPSFLCVLPFYRLPRRCAPRNDDNFARNDGAGLDCRVAFQAPSQ
jgi:hypothetical protein